MHLRTATPDDVPSLYALWGRAFDAPLMVPVYETDDDRLDRTHVALDPLDGGVVGSVYWTPRELGGPDGDTLRAGGVANVAIAPRRGAGASSARCSLGPSSRWSRTARTSRSCSPAPPASTGRAAS